MANNTASTIGLKTFSEQFRDDLLRLDLQTPPDVVVGLSDLGGSLNYEAYKDAEGKDAAIHSMAVSDSGNVLDIATEIRKFLFKRNLQTPSDIEHAIIDLSANQAETMRNMGSVGTDSTINWRSVVVDSGTIDNAADVTRMANLSRNKSRDLTDPSEENTVVNGDGYNYTSLLQTIGLPTTINNFTVPNLDSVSDPKNADTVAAQKLDLTINKYIPDEYTTAVLRDNILSTVYSRTTYVDDYTNNLKNYTPTYYDYSSFTNLNSPTDINGILNQGAVILQNDTQLMNIGAYMLNFNWQARMQQNLYNDTYGKINLLSTDPLELMKIAKDPLDNLIEKNYTITMPVNFVSKAAQFMLGLEGIVSPFDLWESVDLGGKDLKPTFLATNEGIIARDALDPTSPTASDSNTAKDSPPANKKDDNVLLKKTGGGQRWSLYQNLSMNNYSPKYDTPAELINFKKNNPKGIYYISSPDVPPISLLQAREGVSIINNNELSAAFNKGFDDVGGYEKGTSDLVWVNDVDESAGANEGVDDEYLASHMTWETSTEANLRPSSLMDITQKILYIGGVDSPIRNLKTKFRDGKMVYSKGNAVKKVDVIMPSDGGTKNTYKVLDPWLNGFCRTWTKLKPYGRVDNLVRYNQLIRRERNSVIDENANYNIFPSDLNVGTLYDQALLSQDGVRQRFADKHFDEVRARKYMFSIENLAWEGSEEFNNLPTYQQGSSGGRVMWFPPYGLTFSEQSNAAWTKHDFLGRPEPIYTYNNTERAGQLSFMIVVDHPTILNVLVQKELAGMSDEQVDDILAAFFAGCVQYDIFELARIWGVFSNSDLQFFKDVLSGKYPYPANITADKQNSYNIEIQNNTKTIPKSQDDDNLKNTLKNLQFFFPNDIPSTTDKRTYDEIYNEYLGWMTSGQQTGNHGEIYDYCDTIGHHNAAGSQYFVTATTPQGKDSVDIVAKKVDIDKSVDLITKYINAHPTSYVEIGFEAYASTIAPSVAYDQALAARRAYSVAKWYASKIQGLQLATDTAPDEKTVMFEIDLNRSDSTPAVKFTANMATDVKGKDVQGMFSDIGWNFGMPINYWNPSTFTNVSTTTYTEESFKNVEGDNKYFSILSYPASYARRVQLTVKTDLVGSTTATSTPITTAAPTSTVSYSNASSVTTGNVVNKRDIATRLLNKLIGENEYFEFLQKDSPVVFDSLKEKLKYFTPAFHSMTPEGLNSRLTFLNQCVRPGNTLSVGGTDDNAVINTSFGRPPICILRIGDFYNTKMLIETLSIDYNTVGGTVSYDLNPEGIGVQPMLAKVTLNVKYVGGAGLREPVSQLQNALSYNFYANADIYESNSYGQTNVDERYLENLELAYNSTELDIQGLNIPYLATIKPAVPQFTQLGSLVKTYDSMSPDNPDYNADHVIQNGLNIVQYYDYDYAKLYQSFYGSYTLYVNNYFSALQDVLTNNPLDVFVLQYGAFVRQLNFGTNDQVIDDSIYPHLNAHNNDAELRNYFTIGYDSFNKGSSFAVPKLHLYPQVEDRVVNPNLFNVLNFAGISVPKYIDMDYLRQNMAASKTTFENYILCDQWMPFITNANLMTKLDNMPPQAQSAFHAYIFTQFNDYYDAIFSDKYCSFETSRSSFTDFYGKSMAVNSISNGVDGGTAGSSIRYLEVFPSYSGSTGEFDVTTFFDFKVDDCLNKYPYGICFPLPTDEIKPYQQTSAEPDDDSRGLFNYLFNQMSDTKNHTWKNGHRLYFDFTSGKWMRDSVIVTDVKCKTVFEKMSFERLYFGNLTQAVLMADEISKTLNSFSSVKASRDISGYNAIHQSNIRTMLGLAAGATSYDYNKLDYDVATDSLDYNSTIGNAVAAINVSPNLSLEDILFYGFIYQLNDKTFLDSINAQLCSTVTLASDVVLINSFCQELSDNGYDTMKSKITKLYQQYKSILTQTMSSITGTMNKVQAAANTPRGSYQLKMFETAASRVNTFGKSAMMEYVKFISQNPPTTI